MYASPLRRVLAANAVNATFAALPDTFDTPAGDGVIDLSAGGGGGEIPGYLELWPFALGADNDTFSLRVMGWTRLLPGLADGRNQWTSFLIAEFTAIASAAVGLAGGVILATERYADTMTVVAEATNAGQGSSFLTSPGTDLKAHVAVRLEGVERVQVQFRQTGAFTPQMNALYRLLHG